MESQHFDKAVSQGQRLVHYAVKHDHPQTLKFKNNLAYSYSKAARFREASELYSEILPKITAALGPNDGLALMCRVGLTDAYEQLGKLDAAEAVIEEQLAAFRELAKSDTTRSVDVSGALAKLGENLIDQKKFEEAEPILRECLKFRDEKMVDDYRRFNAMSLLGGSLLGQKKYTEAKPLLVNGYIEMKKREAQIQPDGRSILPRAAERVIRYYEATNQPARVSEWREKLNSEKK